jgi:non-ribosomal peptide synthase protein (TIGR01720 family)
MTATEQKLAEIWKKVLGLQHISRDDNFFSLGGDSLLAIQAVNQANHGGLQLTTRMLFQYQTIAELAEQEPQKNTVIAIQKPVSGKVSLLPIVSWFDTLRLARPDYFNQTLLLESSEPLNPDVLQETLNALVVHHDALRLRFRSRPTGPPELFIDSTLSAPLIRVIDLEDESDLGACIQQIEASLSIENGPILRLAVLRQKEGHDLLLFVCHHLAVDGLSWRILLEDLETGYRQSQHGKPIKLPPKTSDLISWGKALYTYLDSDDFSQEVKIWQRYADLTVPPLPSDEQGGVNTVASTESISITLSAEETTALLTQVPVAFRCRTDELLLAAVCSTLRSWIDSEIIALALESHGRASLPGVDVSRTVGWFTSLYPAVLSISADSIPASVAAVRDQLRELPQLGLSFSLGRYLGSEPTQQMLATLPVPQISFNYMGQFGRGRDAKSRNLFRPAAKDAGIGQAPENVRPFSIDIISSVQGDRLEIHWIFSKNLHRRETINELAETFVEVCRRLIAGGWEWSETKPPMPHRPSLLVPINRHGTHPPFFCVHPSGGTSFCYRKLSHHLGADQPFYGFQAPGLEIGEQPFSDLKQMAARYVEEMRLVQPIGPYYIGGWSFGGVIAAEMAQQLRVAEQPVALLAIIDVDPFLSSYQQTQARRMIKLSERIATANDLDPSQIKKLRLGEQVDYLFDGSEQEDRMLDHERFLTLLRVFSAHARARLAYTPALYDGRVAIFRARNQAILEQSQVSPIRLLLRQLTGWLRNGQNNPTMGWDSFCHGVIEQYDIPGHHLSIMNEPFVLILAEQLAEALRHARAAY